MECILPKRRYRAMIGPVSQMEGTLIFFQVREIVCSALHPFYTHFRQAIEMMPAVLN